MSFRKYLVYPALILSLLFGAASVAQAADAEVLKRVIKNGHIRVGMSGNQPPMNVKSRTGAFIGLEVDLANIMAKALGVSSAESIAYATSYEKSPGDSFVGYVGIVF